MADPNPTGTRAPYNIGLSGILDCRELYRGRQRQASLDGVPVYTRVYLVRTKIINSSLRLVAMAPGLGWREPYPDDSNAVLVDTTAAQDGDSPFHFKVTCTYRHVDETEKIPWFRPSQFSFSGSLTSAPAFWHYSGGPTDNATKAIIINSAGDPLSGLDRDEGEFSVSISYNQRPPFNFAQAKAYVGAVNSDIWSGSNPRTWKCQGISANRKYEVIPNITPDFAPVKVFYYETTINLAYRETTWDLHTWDVGFNEIVAGERKKVLAGSDPVSEPVALSNGQAKPPGEPPDLITFRIYRTLPFNITPSLESLRFEPIPQSPYSGFPYSLTSDAVYPNRLT
jgi:hypothetical protein